MQDIKLFSQADKSKFGLILCFLPELVHRQREIGAPSDSHSFYYNEKK